MPRNEGIKMKNQMLRSMNSAGTSLFIALINVGASTLEEPPFYGATAADQLAIANGFADYIRDLSSVP